MQFLHRGTSSGTTNRTLFCFLKLCHSNKIEEIRVKLGFDFSFAVDREGRSGGIAIIWKQSFKCRIINYSMNFINVEVSDNDRGLWRLTGFYGYPERTRRRDSWNLLRNLATMSLLPWCVIGDFNDL